MHNKREIIDSVLSAWTGHYDFAQWLVARKKPKVIVDLGVDYGYSTYAFALQNIGDVYGIDNFNGEEHTGVRDTESFVRRKIKELELTNVKIIKCLFDDIASIWGKPIDILHIDGFHSYESVKHDFETWSKFVMMNGVILFHDTQIRDRGFGVYKVFEEINLPKVNFKQSCGLGVVSRDEFLIEEIKNVFSGQLS